MGYSMRIKDLLDSIVPKDQLGEAEFNNLHHQCRVACGLPQGSDVADLTPAQRETIAALATPVQKTLLRRSRK